MKDQTILVNEKPYEIIELIAKGKGGYNYLAKAKEAPVVVKQIHYEPCDYFQFEENKLNSELRDYKTLLELGIPMPKLLSFDRKKQILVKEYMNGDTLAKITADNKLNIGHIFQIFDMCSTLYPNRLNIDYFPTNFMEHQGVLYYVDYECSLYSDEWNFENWGIYFLANQAGMKRFIESGEYTALIENGKPIKNGLKDIVLQWLNLYETRSA